MVSANSQSIFVSTVCLPWVQPINSRVSLYQSCGLNAIEFGGGVSVSKNSLSQIKRLGSQFLIHNYFPPPCNAFVLNLASGDDYIRQRSLDLVSEAIDLASHIGAPFYSVHAGFITDPTGFEQTSFVFPAPASPDEAASAMNRFIAAMKIVLDCADHFRVGVLVENNVCTPESCGKLLLQTAEEFLSLFSVLPSSHLGILLDTGHLNVTARTLGFDRTAFVEQVAPHVRAIHIHDNDGTADTHQPIRPNSWVIDVLHRPEFASLPLIVEAKFDDITELCQHVSWLKNEIERK